MCWPGAWPVVCFICEHVRYACCCVPWTLKSCECTFRHLELKWRSDNSDTFIRTSLGSLHHMKTGPVVIKSRTDLGYGLDHRLQFLAVAGGFSLRYHKQPGSGGLPAHCFILTGALSFGGKAAGAWHEAHFHMVPRLRTLEAIPLLPVRRHDATYVSTGIRLLVRCSITGTALTYES